jgi:hypothetical protein
MPYQSLITRYVTQTFQVSLKFSSDPTSCRYGIDALAILEAALSFPEASTLSTT